MTSASGGGNEVGGVEGLEPAWGVSGASKGGRSSRSHWGQVSEEAGQLSPASFWLGRPNPPDQWLLLRALGEAEKPDWRSWGGQGPRGTIEDFFLEINCKERVHIIFVGVGAGTFSEIAVSKAKAEITERRVGWGRDTYMG